MADHDQQPGQGRDIEEGEVVSGYHYNAAAGSDTDTDDEDARYYLQASYLHNGQWVKPSSASARRISFGSDGTVSDAAAAVPVARSADAPATRFPCRVCPRDFGSSKAVHGHMKVHAQAAKHLAAVAAAIRASGGPASAVEEVGDSVSTPVALPAMPGLFDDATTITPVQSVCSNNPVMNAGSGSSSSARSSVEPSPTTASVVPAPPAAAPVVPPKQAPIAPPQQAPIAPLLHPPVFDGPLQLAVRGDPGRGFSCRECGRWFPTHQGLGGHVAGHKNRRIAAAAAAAAAAGIDPEDHIACRGGARPPKTHACKICGAEYPTGVSLGGHMRKHYSGKPIVPRKRLRLGNELALALPLQMAHPPAMAVPIVVPPLAAAPLQPAVQAAPAVPAGSVRIFGVNFVQQANP
ncbi:hypothetical protein QYE76_057876 [Lolium multiflorum]|uniref:C2H2-type domain-containing protein n=1 Tax=Lolium multiflorum TaxID=4521 RepID=A0AAD8T454_LOLMU|nr:hypothetical protein QYE76_057876 [Lolium multiflorum]